MVLFTPADLSNSDWALHVAHDATSLGSKEVERGLTFSLSGYGLGPLPTDAPDISGVYCSRPFRWEGCEAQVNSLLLELPLDVDCHDLCASELRKEFREQLRPRTGWERRLAEAPRPTENELIGRLMNGDRTAVAWICRHPELCHDPTRVCWLALPLAEDYQKEDLAEQLLALANPDWRRLWREVPEARWTVVLKTPAADHDEVMLLSLQSEDESLRASSVSLARHAKWQLGEAVHSLLNLEVAEKPIFTSSAQPNPPSCRLRSGCCRPTDHNALIRNSLRWLRARPV